MVPIVIYHKNCNDGFCAAWLLWRHMFRDAEFIPQHYEDEPPEISTFENRKVYIVDFSYKRDFLKKIESVADRLLVLDHHKSACENLKGLPYARFDMNKCGARMVWDYIFLSEPNSPEIHWIVQYVEDRDLWKHELPSTREVNAALASYPLCFEVWSSIAERQWYELATEGKAILRYQDKIKSVLIKDPEITSFEGYDVPIINSGTLQSDIGNTLASHHPFAIIWFAMKDKIVFSLRSKGDMDVSEIAKKFGGGGHKNAAGFSVPMGLDVLKLVYEKSGEYFNS